MTCKPSSSSSERISKQNQYLFRIDNDRQLHITSNFQNGNMILVKQIHQLYYILESVGDHDSSGGRKSWFYFKMRSQRGIKVRIILQNVNIYETIFQEKYHCKPMIKEGTAGTWQELADSFFTFRDQIVLVIDHTFKNAEEVEICLSVPFTYSDNQRYLEDIKRSIHPSIDYKDQILALTPQKRNVHLLTVTEKAGKEGKRTERKPVVLITARVHPGEVSSSFCLQGMLDFLLNYNNLQSYILRKLFIFKIVPMVNPDGICEGNYRMDPQGFNLNRFYHDPSPQQHPAIFQITQLMKSCASQGKIQFYFDLHSHSSIKESFIYGNALDDIVSQTYSELFCRILEENYPRFRTNLSNFGEKQMKHKDKGELMSKQGCGRVVINRLYGVVQSYTVESSIFPASYDCFLSKTVKTQEKNQDFRLFGAENQQVYYYEPTNISSGIEENVIVSQNKMLGRSIMASMLDMLRKNPFTRLPEDFNDNYCKEHSLRLFQNQERFKLLDTKAYQKCRMITLLVRTNLEEKIQKEWHMSGVALEFNTKHWPKEVRKIAISSAQDPNKQTKTIKKNLRVKTEGRENASKSLSKQRKPTKPQTETRQNNIQSHRSISPKDQQVQVFFPEIKYSIELKSQKKQSMELKSATVKEIQLNVSQSSNVIMEGEKVKKRVILEYIQQEIGKINPDKQIFKRTNASLNRLIANKIIEKERAKTRNSHLTDYHCIIQSRRRIATQSKQEETVEVKAVKERLLQESDEELRGLQLKKAQMVKKRFIAANKAIELIKRNDKMKVKLPDLNKLNLIVQNSKKQRQRPPAFLEDTYLRNNTD